MPTDLWNVRTTISAALLVDFAVVRGLTKRQALHGSGIGETDLSDGCTVDAVAHRLGYGSISAFSAAFRTWSGRTPGQFARNQQIHRT